MFRVQKFVITYKKSGQNKLSGRQNTQFLYAVNILTQIVIETKIAKYSAMVQFPLYLNGLCEQRITRRKTWPFIPKRESKQRTAFRGGLIYPSKDLVKVCEISEKKIRETRNNRNLFYNKNILHYLCLNPIYLCWGT